MTEVREPSNVIEMVEMVRQGMQFLASSDLPKEHRQTAGLILDLLPRADYYEIEDSVYQGASELFRETYDGKRPQDIRLDVDCRLPSAISGFWWKGCVTRFSQSKLAFPTLYLAQQGKDGSVLVVILTPNSGPVVVGKYVPGQDQALFVTRQSNKEHDHEYDCSVLLMVASVCSVINQPSFVRAEQVGTRQERRAAQRGGGYTPTAWHKVAWNIGEAVKAKLTRDEPMRCMPLHYTRGHWRKAEEGWNNVERRKDGLWYQWIEGYWSGHPAFGVKRSYHAPKMAKAG